MESLTKNALSKISWWHLPFNTLLLFLFLLNRTQMSVKCCVCLCNAIQILLAVNQQEFYNKKYLCSLAATFCLENEFFFFKFFSIAPLEKHFTCIPSEGRHPFCNCPGIEMDAGFDSGTGRINTKLSGSLGGW